jgi:hypothetical protein
MVFATTSNGFPVNYYGGGSTHKAAELVTFPNIVGRDAPGKTGNAAKPALVSEVGLFIYSESSAVVRIGMWSSTGTNFTSSSNYTLPNNSNIKNLTITDRPVFSGSQYWVGFAIIDPVLVAPDDFGVIWGNASGANTQRIDRTPFSTSSNFLNEDSSGLGPLAYRIGYDTLPTAPLSLAGVVTGATETSVELSWNAPMRDGGRAVSGYRIQISQDNSTWTTLNANTGTTTRTFTINDLVPGIRYYFRVAAINEVAVVHGEDYSGPYSTSVNVLIPEAAPGNAQSFLTITVGNPDPQPLAFSDFGLGIRFIDIEVQYGSEFLYNEVGASTQDSFSEVQIIDAPQSKALYGLRTYEISNLLNATDEGAFEVAKDYLTYFYEPELRVQSITVDLSNLTIEQKIQVLGLEIDSYITVSFTPNGIGDPKVTSGLVTGISHRISLTSHQVELRLRNERNLFTLNSDSKGILDVNTLGP